MARRRFFVDEIRDGAAALTDEDAAHLTRVLRVQPGQQFELSDNREVWLAEITEARKSRVEFRVLEAIPASPALPPIHLFAALFKFDRYEWMIEKVTELGVTRIVPVETERSERGLFEAAHKRVDRWRKIAREASQQSRRTRMPVIDDAIKFRRVRAEGARYLLDEMPGTVKLQITPHGDTPGDATVSLLLGPEGGWTDEERSAAAAAGWKPSSLGPTVLRAETAAIAALALAVHALS
jgi:16S rRNA (uracil1498-N3)-methyltransferase